MINSYFFTLILSIALLFAGNTMAIEEPAYTVIETDGDFELRSYSPKIIAEVVVTGPMDEASTKGFKLVADYIFGNNTAKAEASSQETASQSDSQKISMTAPVTISSEKVSMTAPVTIAPTNTDSLSSNSNVSTNNAEGKTEGKNEQQWRLHFVMPSEYTLDTLPTPNNPAVTLKAVPAKNMAVIRFSGFVGESKVASKTEDLLAWLEEKGIQTRANPELARYNPPWTLPFLRRNEVMLAY